MHRAIRKALERDLKIYFGVLGAGVILSFLLSLVLQRGFVDTFRLAQLVIGFLILIVSAIEGSGAPEMRLAESPLYNVSPTYQGMAVEERIAREQEGFWFMVVGFVYGIAFLGAGVLVGFLAGL